MISQQTNAEILVVDDEPQVLAAIEDMLEDECIVHTATSAENAIRVVKENEGICVIISDQRMPETDGAAFLSKVQKMTRATRIMLTGFADVEAVVRAVNEGKIFAYLSKPWDADKLKVVVHQAIDYYEISLQLEEERRLLENLMNSLPEGVYFKDKEHRYLLANEPTAELIGVDSADDLIGKRIADLLENRVHDHELEEKQILITGLPQIDRVYKKIDESGSVRWLSATKAPVLDESGKPYRIVGITRDVTERVKMETETRLLLDISRAVGETATVEDAYRCILSKIAEATSWKYGEVWVMDPADDRLKRGQAWHFDDPDLEEFSNRSSELTFARGDGFIGRIWEGAECEWLPDCGNVTPSLFRRAKWAKEAGLRAAMGVPVLLDNKTVVAVLLYFHTESIQRDERQIDLISGVARQLGDIVARRRADEARRESDERNRQLLDAAGEGIYGIDVNGMITFCNPATTSMLGFRNQNHVIGQRAHDLFHHSFEDGSPYPVEQCGIYRALKSGEHFHSDDEYFFKADGTAIPVEFRAEPILEDGLVVGAVVTFSDITERKSYESKLAANEARFRDFGEAVSDFFAETDNNFQFTYVSERFLETTGHDSLYFLGLSLLDLDSADSGEPQDDNGKPIDNIRNCKPFRNFEAVFKCQDGQKRILSISGRPIFDESQTFDGYRIAGQEVTGRVLLQRQIREQQALLANVLESVPQYVYWKDCGGAFLGCNGSFAQFLGLDTSEAIAGRTNSEVLGGDLVKIFTSSDQEVLRSGEPKLDFEWAYTDGEDRERTIRESKVPLRDPSGAVIGLLSVFADITDGRQMAQQLQQAQKMDAIGKLTGGVAHDFNNLLTVIIGNLQLMQRTFKGNERTEKQVAMAHDAARRGADLTKRLLAFSRKQVLEPEITSVNELVAGMEPLMQRTIGENVTINSQLDQDAPSVKIDISQFENAILNLAVNARDAMPGGGRIDIETSVATLDTKYAELNRDVAPGEYVLVSVTDTGEGIPENLLEQVFEPFFTTKEVGKGTGLGLSMVYGFVKQSGGHAAIYSEVGVGTTIRLYFPICRDEAVSDIHVDEIPDEMPSGTERILVVEDDAEVRFTVSSLLDSLGYTVVEAESGDAGLKVFEADAEIALVLTDVVMPGELSGMELAKRVVEKRPDVKAIVTSGYPRDAMGKNGILDSDIAFIGKPYEQEALAHKVRELLDGAQA